MVDVVQEEECIYNQGIINFRAIRFMINGSRIELRCRKCNRMVGWWHIFTEKIVPLKRTKVGRRTQSNALTSLIEFSTNKSRIELFCGKCHGVICWWPIRTEQNRVDSAHETKKSLAIPTRTKVTV